MGRMIHAAMWEDEFFTAMPIFDKLLWIGLITVCADDQGRLQDSPGMIRSKVFPVDDVPLVDIEAGLDRFYKDGKVVRYIAGKHKCIQIVNWWKHQKPQWAGKSIYPACTKWIDKERYHTTGNIISNTNFDKNGGFPPDYIVAYKAGKVKCDVKGEVEGDVKVEYLPEKKSGKSAPIKEEPKPSKNNELETRLINKFTDITGIKMMPTEYAKNQKLWYQAVRHMLFQVDGDIDEAESLLEFAIEKMKKIPLNCYTPNSAISTYDDVMGKEKK